MHPRLVAVEEMLLSRFLQGLFRRSEAILKSIHVSGLDCPTRVIESGPRIGDGDSETLVLDDEVFECLDFFQGTMLQRTLFCLEDLLLYIPLDAVHRVQIAGESRLGRVTVAARDPSGRAGAEKVHEGPATTAANRTPALSLEPLGLKHRHPTRRARHLFSCWAEVSSRLRRAETVLLLFDFDGTLVRLRRRPELVRLPDTVRGLLARLSRHPRFRFWIVSGRRVADLRRRVSVPGVRYLGLYGWEGDGRSPGEALRTPGLLRRARERVQRRLVGLPLVWLEDKEFSFVVHFRGASRAAARRARRSISPALRPFRRRLRLLRGKGVWEILPRENPGKGRAVLSLLAGMSSATLPVYFGDDTSDESVFAVLRRGVTVRVGRASATRARFYVRNPSEVRVFLEKVSRELK